MNVQSIRPTSNFEIVILRFISVVGAVRLVYEVFQDVINHIPTGVLVMDILMLVILSLTILLTYSNIPVEFLTIPFSIIMTVFISYQWVSTGGVSGVSNYNFFMLIIALGMVSKGKKMIWTVGLVMVLEICLVLIWEFKYEWLESSVLLISVNSLQYILAVALVSFFGLYLRFRYDFEEDRLLNKIELLKAKIVEVQNQNDAILVRKKQFQKVNAELSEKVDLRKRQLENRNKMLTEFIRLSLREFYPPLQATLSAIAKVENNHNDDVLNMMTKSSEHLDAAYKNMTIKMRKNLS